jgi:hypothetical protein
VLLLSNHGCLAFFRFAPAVLRMLAEGAPDHGSPFDPPTDRPVTSFPPHTLALASKGRVCFVSTRCTNPVPPAIACDCLGYCHFIAVGYLPLRLPASTPEQTLAPASEPIVPWFSYLSCQPEGAYENCYHNGVHLFGLHRCRHR